jgi:hypothetical protein
MHAFRRFATAAAAAAAVVLAGAPVPPASAAPPAAAPRLQPGVYAQINPGTKKPADPGNQIVLIRGKDGKLAFSVNAVRSIDLNQGYAVGILPSAGPTVVWTQLTDGAKCKLTFTARANGFSVVQDATFGDCGFGSGVLADGIYQRSGDAEKLGAPPGP